MFLSQSALCTWNIDRRAIDPNKPDASIDVSVSTCLELNSHNQWGGKEKSGQEEGTWLERRWRGRQKKF